MEIANRRFWSHAPIANAGSELHSIHIVTTTTTIYHCEEGRRNHHHHHHCKHQQPRIPKPLSSFVCFEDCSSFLSNKTVCFLTTATSEDSSPFTPSLIRTRNQFRRQHRATVQHPSNSGRVNSTQDDDDKRHEEVAAHARLVSPVECNVVSSRTSNRQDLRAETPRESIGSSRFGSIPPTATTVPFPLFETSVDTMPPQWNPNFLTDLSHCSSIGPQRLASWEKDDCGAVRRWPLSTTREQHDGMVPVWLWKVKSRVAMMSQRHLQAANFYF